MRNFCEADRQKKSQIFITMLLLLLYRYFQLRSITGFTGQAGFACLDIGSRAEMAKIVRFFIQVRNFVCWYLLRYRTHFDIVPTDIGNIEVAPGDFCIFA